MWIRKKKECRHKKYVKQVPGYYYSAAGQYRMEMILTGTAGRNSWIISIELL